MRFEVVGVVAGGPVLAGGVSAPGSETKLSIRARCAEYTIWGGSFGLNDAIRRLRSERANFGLQSVVWASDACRRVSWHL